MIGATKLRNYRKTVKSPGKFEGENPYVPYLYDEYVMNGYQSDSEYLPDAVIDTIDLSDTPLCELEEALGLEPREYMLLTDDLGFVVEVDQGFVDRLRMLYVPSEMVV